MCTFEFVVIKNAKYCQEPWMLSFIFRICAWNVRWPKKSWQNLLEAKGYKSVSLMEVSKNSCSHIYCCNVYVLTTCFITSAPWAVIPVINPCTQCTFHTDWFWKGKLREQWPFVSLAPIKYEIYEKDTTDLNQFASTLTVVVNQTNSRMSIVVRAWVFQ